VLADREDDNLGLRMERALNWDDVQRNWPQLKGRVKQRWTKLSEEQLTAIAGRRVHLVSRIQETYKLTREETERKLADWQARLQPEELPK
jgi:uncharacterized protein YjbJ (UPF0337 family)